MYERLQKRLRRMASSDHFITNASDKAAIAEAADRIEQLSVVLAHRTAQLDRLTSAPAPTPEAAREIRRQP